MATPAAVLSLLVKAQGAQAAAAQITAVDNAGRRAGKSMGTLQKANERTTKTFSAVGSAAKSAGILVGAAGLAAGLKTAVSEYREAQKVGAQTSAVLKSTGNAAKTSKKHIEDLAGAISKKSGIDDETIQSGENLLLTFTKIRNETGKGNKIFDRTTQVITDMSVALGQDFKSSAIQVGKALQDPVKGITALRRVGVNFNQQQSDQIKKMVESGDQLKAQRTILKELTKEFGGSAAAQATAGDKLSVSLHNLAEAAGGVLVPQFDKAAKALTNLINDFVEGKGIAHAYFEAFKADATALAQVVGPVFTFLKNFFETLPGPVKIATAAVAAFFAVMAVTNPVIAVLAAVAAAAIAIKRNWGTIGPIFNTVKDAVVTAVNTMVSTFNSVKSSVVSFVTGVTSAITGEVSKWKVAFAVFGVLKTIVGAGLIAVIAVIKTQLKLVAPIFSAAFGVIKAIVGGAIGALKAIVSGGLQSLRGVIQVFGGILKGDFGQIWEGVKNIFRGIGKALAGILRAQAGTVAAAGKALAMGILNAFKAAFNLAHEVAEGVRAAIAKGVDFGVGLGKALAEGIKKGAKDAIGTSLLDVIGITGDGPGKARKTGEGIGKTLAKSGSGTVKAGKGSAALKGANSALGPFARIGASMGLSVSSGLRAGAITSSGNVSYHSSGEAIDVSNGFNTPQEMKFFRLMKSRYGSQLAELIFTPGGAGIKDGKPYTYTGKVAADHWDHVHVALDLGKPGPGIGGGRGLGRADGLGAFMGDGIGGNVKAVWQFLIANGFSQAQAAGIIGVMQGESGAGLDTKALNDKSGAFGIAQWLGDRKSALMKRKNPNSLQTQLNFLLSELHGPEAAAFKKIKGAHSIEEAVNAWLFSFERPGPGEAKVSMRLGNARNVFNSLKGVGGGSGGGGGTGGGNKNALQKAIEKNLDRIDALRKKLRHLPTGKKFKGQRTKIQDQISSLLAKNRDIRDQIRNLPKGGAPAEKISNYEMIQSLAGTAIAQAATTPDVADDILANTQLRDATTFRIKQVRKALKKPNLTQATRKRLTDELGTLLGTHTELQGTLKDLREKPIADALQKQSDLTDAKLQIAQTTDSLADDLGPLGDKVTLLTSIYEAQSKKFGANSVEAQMALANLTSATKDLTTAQHDAMVQGVQYQLKLGDAALIAAKIRTPGDVSDDLAALQGQLQVATDAYNNAVNVTGNTDDMIEFGGQVLSLRDAIEQLQGATEQNTQALLDLEKQRSEDLRRTLTTSQTELAQLQKAIAGIANGTIGGRVGLGYMSPSYPGGGTRY